MAVEKILAILKKPLDPEDKFELQMEMFDELNAKYHDTLFYFNDDLRCCHDCDLEYPDSSDYTSSIIKMPEKNNHQAPDKYSKQWEEAFLDHVLIVTYFGYYNKALEKMHKAILVSKYFKRITKLKRKDVQEKYKLNWRDYEKEFTYAREVLIECWNLDAYGNASDVRGELCSRDYVDYLRTQRTGIRQGYISQHRNWHSYYDGDDPEMEEMLNGRNISKAIFSGTNYDWRRYDYDEL